MPLPFAPKLPRALLRLVPRSLAARASLATSIVFLVGMTALAVVSLKTFDNQLTAVLFSEQDLLAQRLAENVDQRIDLLQTAMRDSAARIVEADLATPATARRPSWPSPPRAPGS